MQSNNQVLIIGGGVAGLTAALSLSRLDIRTVIVEKSDRLGGWAAQYTCKATDACVSCGACTVSAKVDLAYADPLIEVHTGSRVCRIDKQTHFQATIEQVSPSSLTGEVVCECGAVILASGFQPYDPRRMPYGYNTFANVLTNLDLERMLRRDSVPTRPSDGRVPKRMAFVQCVGSRDVKLGHPWCSKVCCASALRMARLIKMRCPDTEITLFYIDVQTFGSTFQRFYDDVKNEVRMIRAIPGDVFRTAEDRLKVVFYDAGAAESREEPFDMLVLSVAITPSPENHRLAATLGLAADETGFIPSDTGDAAAPLQGVFTAGTVMEPMGIAEAAASADRAAWKAASFLRPYVNRSSSHTQR
jgi:heterodisulfide reductase subunit A